MLEETVKMQTSEGTSRNSGKSFGILKGIEWRCSKYYQHGMGQANPSRQLPYVKVTKIIIIKTTIKHFWRTYSLPCTVLSLHI